MGVLKFRGIGAELVINFGLFAEIILSIQKRSFEKLAVLDEFKNNILECIVNASLTGLVITIFPVKSFTGTKSCSVKIVSKLSLPNPEASQS